MKIQLNTDDHVDATRVLAAEVSAMVEQALERFGEHVTRVEVHLSNENGGKSGQQDQRCMLEARLEGLQPLAVTEHAATLKQAVHGAAHKLVHLLDRTLGRLHDQREKPTGLSLSLSESEPEPESNEDRPTWPQS
jgi:ribosome-associated translation inhibitor RaiA